MTAEKRKILIRAGMLPTDSYDYMDMIEKDLIGSNIGNLVYQYSICRTLMTEDVEFVPTGFRDTGYGGEFTPEEIDEINQTFDCFVIPLANAFRKSFRKSLRSLTRLVTKLKIPCYVIGVGLQAPYADDAAEYPFDGAARNFVRAVLEKSAIIGVRGGITGEYLKRLGFREESDYTVIGCPSMYMYPELSVRVPAGGITRDSRVSFNISPGAGKKEISYIFESAAKFKEAYYLPQNWGDLKTMYAGISRQSGYRESSFPHRLTDPYYKDGNARFFDSVTSWQKFLRQMDFSFGTRLHGNVMGVLSGIPTMHIPFDARTRELVEYHALTHVESEDIKKRTDIFELINRADFHAPEKVQKRNFEHYLDFLNRNKIRHIYSEGETAVFDEAVRKVSFHEPLTPLSVSDLAELTERMDKYADFVSRLKSELQAEAAENRALEKQMNSKAVRMAIQSRTVINYILRRKKI